MNKVPVFSLFPQHVIFFFLEIICVICLHLCLCPTCMPQPQNSEHYSEVSFLLPCVFLGQAQVIKLGSKCHYLLNHLASLVFWEGVLVALAVLSLLVAIDVLKLVRTFLTLASWVLQACATMCGSHFEFSIWPKVWAHPSFISCRHLVFLTTE